MYYSIQELFYYLTLRILVHNNRGRNCYACRGFRHMACHCRNQGRGGVIEERRVEYGGERFEDNTKQIEHLKEVENLEALD